VCSPALPSSNPRRTKMADGRHFEFLIELNEAEAESRDRHENLQKCADLN